MERPRYCQYASGFCNQELSSLKPFNAFFIYPSEPAHLSFTVAQCVKQLQIHSSEREWQTWEKLIKAGQIIFCEVCKGIRASKLVVANITTLNFNVLFELGFAIGSGKAVLPVRDTTYERDKVLFDEIGVFDSLRYEPFHNSNDLASLVTRKDGHSTFSSPSPEVNRYQPIYYVRSHVDTEGSIRLFSALKKGWWRFRTFDSRETARLSLHEAHRQVGMSVAVIAHLMDPNRVNAQVHNARAAFVCGMAMALGKHVLMLQEGFYPQAIDYRDIVVPYKDASSIPFSLERILRGVTEAFQSDSLAQISVPKGMLEQIDMGDLAAENEIQTLMTYLVKTPEYQQAVQGHARLVVGRKGSGKSALFYAIRNAVHNPQGTLVLDLKPEGHQFTKLRETVLKNLTEGMALHTLTAFWNYILLLELAHKLLAGMEKRAYGSPASLNAYNGFKKVYEEHHKQGEGDFSERVLRLVDRVVSSFPAEKAGSLSSNDITSMIYASDIRELSDMVVKNLDARTQVWLLLDNLDKGWPTRGATTQDIMILRCLLEATRKLQRSLSFNKVDFNSIVFIRKDIYDLLVDETPDRGKETVANLDWSDTELLKELLLRRFSATGVVTGRFDEVWQRLFDPHVGGHDSCRYVLERTFMRPRDVLNFVRKSIQIAVSRQHERVEADDIREAERGYSEDMLKELYYEIRDVFPKYPQILDKFIGEVGKYMSKDDLTVLLWDAGVPDSMVQGVVDVLLWFCFLGVVAREEEEYAYQVFYNLPKLKALTYGVASDAPVYVIHPAFRIALEVA